jgi:hypothetical protein
MHPSDGELRAHLDGGPTSDREGEGIGAHLAACARCAARAAVLGERAERVRVSLELLDPRPREAPAATAAARARLEAVARHPAGSGETGRPMAGNQHSPPPERWGASLNPEESLMRKLLAGWRRPAWAAVAAGLILVFAFALPPVRAIAVDFLNLFRVQRVAVAPINPGDLPERLGTSTQLQALLSDQILFDENGEPEKVTSAAEATSLSGYQVRLPATLGRPEMLAVAPGGRASITVDKPRIEAVLREIGRTEIEIPDELHRTTMTVDLPRCVQAAYGGCGSSGEDGDDGDEEERHPHLGDCTVLIQLPSPRVSAPSGLPIDRIGEAFLQLMGMPADEVARFSSTIDWSTTLVIPIPRHSTSYQQVTVDGVPGTLIRHRHHGRLSTTLIWVKDGIIYSLTGPHSGAEALEIANSLG